MLPMPYRNRARLGLAPSKDQHIGDLLHLGIPDLKLNFLLAIIQLDPDPLRHEPLLDLLCVVELLARNRKYRSRNRSEPYGERPCVMLDQNPEKALNRSV